VPFTFSHPAAALGLGWIGLPMAALVAGTMVPDVPMFVPGPVEYSTTHSGLGVATIDVLIGCIGVVIWVGLLHDPIVDICPAFVRERLPATMRYTRRQWTLVPAAVLVGAATHVAWDSFTHEERWGVRRIAWLRGEHEGWARYHWAQALSTTIGFAIVASWSLRTVLRRPRGRRRSTLPWGRIWPYGPRSRSPRRSARSWA
jgi:hypothetical protein